MIKLALSTAVLAAAVLSIAAAPAPDLPVSIYADPPVDAAHPASELAIQFDSHGSKVNGVVFRPAGEGVHPTVVFCHGLPGNEQSLDLARAMQRAGWTVITFHYRGSWGSGGTYALLNGVEDAQVLLARLREPDTARAWGVDPAHIVLMGHSYGGLVASRAAAAPDVQAVALIAPWNPADDARDFAKLSPAELDKFVVENFNDIDGRLAGATGGSLARDIIRDHAQLDLNDSAPVLARRPVLLLSATHDSADDQADALLAALKAAPGVKLTDQRMDTSHSFDDHRIALEVAVLRWLALLSGAPG